MRAQGWAVRIEQAAEEGPPLTEAELRELAAAMRDVPARLDRVERLVDKLRDGDDPPGRVA